MGWKGWVGAAAALALSACGAGAGAGGLGGGDGAGGGGGAAVGGGAGGGSAGTGGGSTGTGGGAGGGSASGGGSGGGAAGGSFDGLDCDVANLLATRCVSCHGAVPSGGASFSLLSRADLIAPSPAYAGQTIAQRCLARMQQTVSPMPPAPNAPATAAEIAALQSWVNAGTPVASCGSAPDAGTPPTTTDGGTSTGPVPTTCASGLTWLLGNSLGGLMNPGLACRSCHLQRRPSKAFYFMGTAYPAAHEKDLCVAHPPSGMVVDIIDANGNVALSLPVDTLSGNFYSASLTAGVALPYRAQVRDAQGRTVAMQGAQTDGDCNSCHTEQGANGAPGRIVWPQ